MDGNTALVLIVAIIILGTCIHKWADAFDTKWGGKQDGEKS